MKMILESLQRILNVAVAGFLIFTFELSDCDKSWEAKPNHNYSVWTWRHEVHKNITQANTKSNSIRIIFLGDSITDGWSWNNWGKSIWDKEYAPLGAVNYGISGDRTEHLLWRIQNGQLDKLTNPPPKLIVLCIGTNNIGVLNYTDNDVAKGVETVVNSLGKFLPQTNILLLGLFPRQYSWHFERVANINLKIARLDKYNYGLRDGNKTTNERGLETNKRPRMIRFFDMWTHFAKSWGHVVPELFKDDLLHLNNQGYVKWSQVMNSTLMEMLK